MRPVLSGSASFSLYSFFPSVWVAEVGEIIDVSTEKITDRVPQSPGDENDPGGRTIDEVGPHDEIVAITCLTHSAL